MSSPGMRISAVSQSVNNKSAVKAGIEALYSDKEIVLETDNLRSQYTKSEINRMSTAELQELAFSVGIENAYETKGSALKQILIEKFDL